MRPDEGEHTMPAIQKITPCLWFDTQAEEAAKFYTAIFKNSQIVSMTRYGEAEHEVHGRPAGMVITVAFLNSRGRPLPRSTVARCSHSTRPSRSRSVARRRKKWTIIGRNSRKAEMQRPNSANLVTILFTSVRIEAGCAGWP
jgi:hypothetical protein